MFVRCKILRAVRAVATSRTAFTAGGALLAEMTGEASLHFRRRSSPKDGETRLYVVLKMQT